MTALPLSGCIRYDLIRSEVPQYRGYASSPHRTLTGSPFEGPWSFLTISVSSPAISLNFLFAVCALHPFLLNDGDGVKIRSACSLLSDDVIAFTRRSWHFLLGFFSQARQKGNSYLSPFVVSSFFFCHPFQVADSLGSKYILFQS